jgi:hypothetical protein
MNAHVEVKADERTAEVVHRANTWGLNVISFGLLLDIIYRSVFLDEAAWDLFALIFASGAISWMYMARQKALGQVISRKLVVALAVLAVVSAVAGAFLAMR